MTDGVAGVDLWVLVVIAVAICAGALVQSLIGIGLGLVAAPVVTLLAPELMPGGMLLVVTVLPVITLWREHDEIDWRGLGWAFPARVVGTAIGVWIVAAVDERALGVAVGVVVLLAVVLTVRTFVIPVTRTTLSIAGAIGGITGTASSIGGPPMAVLYQHRSPRQIRTTLAVYFVSGAALSIAGLGWSGELTLDEARLAGLMVAPLLLGFALSFALRQRLPVHVVRPAVLAVCGGAAVLLIVRSLVG